jgi:hypothetical protein
VRLDAVTLLTGVSRLVAPRRTRVRPGPGSKFVPVTPSVVPHTAIPGVNPVTVGTAGAACTGSGPSEVSEPVGVVTTTEPDEVLPPRHTTSSVAVALCTVAATPFTVTVFSLGVALKPSPRIRTPQAPATASAGISRIVVCVAGWRVIVRMLPTAS